MTVIMAADRTKYPPLPPPPTLPAWRDTPEREAYWHELEVLDNNSFLGRRGCLVFFILLSVDFAVIGGLTWRFLSSISAALSAALIGASGSALIGVVVLQVFQLFIFKLKLAAKYGFYMRELKRPDFSREIGAVLAGRPGLDDGKFRSMWQSDEYADAAAGIMKARKTCWRPLEKMLYPNDPLLLFFYGRTCRSGGNRMLLDPGSLIEFFEILEDEFCFPDPDWWEEIEFDTMTFSGLVELCVRSRKAAETHAEANAMRSSK